MLSYRRYEVFELILPFFANDINFVCLSILSSKKHTVKKIHKIYGKKNSSCGCRNSTVKKYGNNILGFTVLT